MHRYLPITWNLGLRELNLWMWTLRFIKDRVTTKSTTLVAMIVGRWPFTSKIRCSSRGIPAWILPHHRNSRPHDKRLNQWGRSLLWRPITRTRLTWLTKTPNDSSKQHPLNYFCMRLRSQRVLFSVSRTRGRRMTNSIKIGLLKQLINQRDSRKIRK